MSCGWNVALFFCSFLITAAPHASSLVHWGLSGRTASRRCLIECWVSNSILKFVPQRNLNAKAHLVHNLNREICMHMVHGELRSEHKGQLRRIAKAIRVPPTRTGQVLPHAFTPTQYSRLPERWRLPSKLCPPHRHCPRVQILWELGVRGMLRSSTSWEPKPNRQSAGAATVGAWVWLFVWCLGVLVAVLCSFPGSYLLSYLIEFNQGDLCPSAHIAPVPVQIKKSTICDNNTQEPQQLLHNK